MAFILHILYSIIFSVGAINALVPVLIIVIFIGAAAGLSRGFSFFNLFGIGTFVGLSPKGKGTLAYKTLKKSYLKPRQKPLKVTKTKIKADEKKKQEAINKDFQTYFKPGLAAGAAQIKTTDKSGAAIFSQERRAEGNKGLGAASIPNKNATSTETSNSKRTIGNQFISGLGKATSLTSPLVRGSILAGAGFVNMVAKGKLPKKTKELFYKRKDEEKYDSRYSSGQNTTVLEDTMASIAIARQKLSKLKKDTTSSNTLSKTQKSIKMAELNGADAFFSRRLKNLEDSFAEINKQQDIYKKRLIQISNIQDPNIRAVEQKKLDEQTLKNFTKIYNTLFDTRKDLQTNVLIKKVTEPKQVQKYNKYRYKLTIGNEKGEENPEELGLISFNFGRGEDKNEKE